MKKYILIDYEACEKAGIKINHFEMHVALIAGGFIRSDFSVKSIIEDGDKWLWVSNKLIEGMLPEYLRVSERQLRRVMLKLNEENIIVKNKNNKQLHTSYVKLGDKMKSYYSYIENGRIFNKNQQEQDDVMQSDEASAEHQESTLGKTHNTLVDKPLQETAGHGQKSPDSMDKKDPEAWTRESEGHGQERPRISSNSISSNNKKEILDKSNISKNQKFQNENAEDGLPINFRKWTIEDFRNSISVNKRDISQETLKDFFAYWTEPDTKGNPKFKQTGNPKATWCTARRLQTWAKNNFLSPFKQQNNQSGTNIPTPEKYSDL